MSIALAWGLRVSAAFRSEVFNGCFDLGLNPDYLMACMAFETGESFRPDKKNGAGSGAVGLIQFMPATARGLGTTTAALAAMMPERQLEFVFRYFKPYAGKLVTLSDHYMAILWPRAIGAAESSVLWSAQASPVTYRQNAGLDANKDGVITKAEAAAKVAQKLVKGMGPDLVWRGPCGNTAGAA